MGREKHGLAALANAAHQLPDRTPRLRIEAGRELVEEHHVGIVDQRQRDEEPLLLAAGERHEPRVALVGEAELFEQPPAVHGCGYSDAQRSTASQTLIRFCRCACWSCTPIRS